MSFAGPSSIYDIQYYGDYIITTVTTAAVVVHEWIANTLHIHKHKLSKLLIGLDTEWCMPTKPDGHQQVAIIQLCVGKTYLIFQLYHADDIPPSLIQFLGHKKFKFVGKEALVLDGLQKVIPKPREITMSEWNAKELTIEQIEYACLDASVSLELGIFLSKHRREIIQYLENTSPKKIVNLSLEFDQTTNDSEQLDDELNLRQSFGEYEEEEKDEIGKAIGKPNKL
ncbi:hypothetical protein GH714_003049 [Hevea brasiliensis]|uniref:3'-5' exonuclease domain-containing protein n=1 Tax=Hevea brasiliensis TaxID=3981 RepID=A0A6A6N6P9_HEVBR|nr:hypothetical protein GH714_002950 [Hevea brasiliensis]KAF2321828.1 hypothetical protein GH714_002988 [Hevea brasiliensis]KAF2321842.1 hypothetical protein GH714_003049 [Hevea brasiliensis]